MGSFSISEEIIGYLDNESNKLIIGKHLLDSFKETYTVNSAVLVDASNALDYLKFSMYDRNKNDKLQTRNCQNEN